MSLALYPSPNAGLADFIKLWAVTYGGLIAVYFLLCGLFHWVNSLYPERRIQSRPMKKQIAMEIGTSVTALASIAAYVAGGLFIQAKGWALTPWPLTWWSAPLTFVASLVIYDAWFYWGHRMMHTKLLYRFHAHHHRSLVPTPWSKLRHPTRRFCRTVVFPRRSILAADSRRCADRPQDIRPSDGHRWARRARVFRLTKARAPWPMLCTTFHDQHHGHFNCNYANTFSWWDRIMGTIHPTYDDLVRKFESVASKGRNDPPQQS